MDVDRLNISECAQGDTYQLIELIVGSIFANGLPRYGSHHAFEPATTIPRNKYFPMGVEDPTKSTRILRRTSQ